MCSRFATRVSSLCRFQGFLPQLFIEPDNNSPTAIVFNIPPRCLAEPPPKSRIRRKLLQTLRQNTYINGGRLGQRILLQHRDCGITKPKLFNMGGKDGWDQEAIFAVANQISIPIPI